jgi:hypothetical protein
VERNRGAAGAGFQLPMRRTDVVAVAAVALSRGATTGERHLAKQQTDRGLGEISRNRPGERSRGGNERGTAKRSRASGYQQVSTCPGERWPGGSRRQMFDQIVHQIVYAVEFGNHFAWNSRFEHLLYVEQKLAHIEVVQMQILCKPRLCGDAGVRMEPHASNGRIDAAKNRFS